MHEVLKNPLINFTSDELNWLARHPSFQNAVRHCLEDALNVNSLDDGEPDLSGYYFAVKAVRLTMEAINEGIIAGPYNAVHWQKVIHHLNIENISAQTETKFWSLFSFLCICCRDEDEGASDEEIYLRAMVETEVYLSDLNTLETSVAVANLSSGAVQKIQGEGVDARLN